MHKCNTTSMFYLSLSKCVRINKTKMAFWFICITKQAQRPAVIHQNQASDSPKSLLQINKITALKLTHHRISHSWCSERLLWRDINKHITNRYVWLKILVVNECVVTDESHYSFRWQMVNLGCNIHILISWIPLWFNICTADIYASLSY